MKTVLLLFLTCLISFVITTNAQDATKIIAASKHAYGDAWDKIKFIRMHHLGHTQWIEQSENPDGPFAVSYDEVDEIRSVDEIKLYQQITSENFQSEASPYKLVINNNSGLMNYGDRSFAMPYPTLQQQTLWHLYDPIHLLKIVSANNYVKIANTVLEGVDHYQLSFIESGLLYELFINKNTFLISEARIDTYLPYEFFFSLWGKFKTKIQYTLYSLNKGNLVYPLQWDVYRAGHLWKKITVKKIEFLQSIPDSVFTIPQEFVKVNAPKQKIADASLQVDKVINVADGIFVIPGNWNTGWVEQEDGILVIEAPISSGYSVQLINEIKKRYPNKKIKGVVVSSDAWPHLAGVREYFASQIPVYTHSLNKEILNRIVAADYSIEPDHFEKSRPKPVYNFIDQPLEINDKKNPIKIFPVNGEGGERMVAIYFPNQKVLYASDLIQRLRSGEFFFIEYLMEVRNLVRKYNLQVNTIYAMHTKPISWQEVEDVLNKNEKQ
jgi:hypothetical protein